MNYHITIFKNRGSHYVISHLNVWYCPIKCFIAQHYMFTCPHILNLKSSTDLIPFKTHQQLNCTMLAERTNVKCPGFEMQQVNTWQKRSCCHISPVYNHPLYQRSFKCANIFDEIHMHIILSVIAEQWTRVT